MVLDTLNSFIGYKCAYLESWYRNEKSPNREAIAEADANFGAAVGAAAGYAVGLVFGAAGAGSAPAIGIAAFFTGFAAGLNIVSIANEQDQRIKSLKIKCFVVEVALAAGTAGATIIGKKLSNQFIKNLPPFTNNLKSDIGKKLNGLGFTKRTQPASNGGDMWTKNLPDGRTVGVRVDGPEPRIPKKDWADEVPHVHKEVFDTNDVEKWATKPYNKSERIGDNNLPTSDPGEIHIPYIDDSQ